MAGGLDGPLRVCASARAHNFSNPSPFQSRCLGNGGRSTTPFFATFSSSIARIDWRAWRAWHPPRIRRASARKYTKMVASGRARASCTRQVKILLSAPRTATKHRRRSGHGPGASPVLRGRRGSSLGGCGAGLPIPRDRNKISQNACRVRLVGSDGGGMALGWRGPVGGVFRCAGRSVWCRAAAARRLCAPGCSHRPSPLARTDFWVRLTHG